MNMLKIPAMQSLSFLSFKESKSGEIFDLGGSEYELIKIFSRLLKFEYKIVIPPDRTWGKELEDGNWTGIIGMLQRKEANFSVNYLARSYDRSLAVDFSFPYSTAKVSFVILRAGFLPKDFIYLYPFQPIIWILIVIAFLLYAVLLTIAEFSQTTVKKRPSSVFHQLVRSTYILIKGFKSSKCVSSISSRILLAFFFLSTMVFRYSFNSVFFSFLIHPLKETQISNFQQLEEVCQNGKVKATVIAGTAVETLVHHNKALKAINNHLYNYPETILPNLESAFAALQKGFAVIHLESFLEDIIAGYEDKFFISSDFISLLPVSVAFAKGFCYVNNFDDIILRLIETGVYTKIDRDFNFLLHLKRRPDPVHIDMIRAVSMDDLVGTFWLHAPCCIVATSVFLCEFIHAFFFKCRKISRKKLKIMKQNRKTNKL